MTRYNKRVRIQVGHSLPKRIARAVFCGIVKPVFNVGAILLLLLVTLTIRPFLWFIRLLVRAAN